MSLADDLAERVPDAVVERGQQNDKPLIVSNPEHVHDLLATAKELGFTHLPCLTAVDWPKGELESNATWLGFKTEPEGDDAEPTFHASRGWQLDDVDDGLMEVVYNLYSYDAEEHLAVQVWLPREVEACKMPSAADIWRAANWHEREVYDLFGVTFTGHPNLTRIFMPEDWEGHPHRKDYDLTKEQFIYREDGQDRVTTDPGKGW